MLLPDNVHPENSIYYNASFVLKIIQEKDKLDMLKLYYEVKQLKEISFSVFILCLDWLYLLNIVEVKEGKVELCS